MELKRKMVVGKSGNKTIVRVVEPYCLRMPEQIYSAKNEKLKEFEGMGVEQINVLIIEQ